MKKKKCKECKAICSGAGREGVATQCSFYDPDTTLKRNVKILEITRCGECPHYDLSHDRCEKGAAVQGENFFKDCPLEEK